MQFNRTMPVLPGRYVYKNSLDCFRHIIREQGGLQGLYRGWVAPVVGVTPEKISKIFVNDYLRWLFEDTENVTQNYFIVNLKI